MLGQHWADVMASYYKVRDRRRVADRLDKPAQRDIPTQCNLKMWLRNNICTEPAESHVLFELN